MNLQKIAEGVLISALAGAALRILFAPDKGLIFRKKASGKNYDYSEELETKFNELIDNVTRQFDALVKEVNQMAEEGKLKKVKTHSA
jgi:gas vesicle protein